MFKLTLWTVSTEPPSRCGCKAALVKEGCHQKASFKHAPSFSFSSEMG
jgi:hypothetical protein